MGAKNIVKSKCPEGTQKFLDLNSLEILPEKFSGFSIEKYLNLSVSHIQNKTRKIECIWVKIRVALLAENGAPS